jgi:hypothetical protein
MIHVQGRTSLEDKVVNTPTLWLLTVVSLLVIVSRIHILVRQCDADCRTSEKDGSLNHVILTVDLGGR